VALRQDVPNREVLRDSVLAAPANAWETVYSLIDGKLPLDQLLKPGQPRVVYVQGEVTVSAAGEVEVLVDGPGATFWVDEDQFDKSAKMQLSAGRHVVTVRMVAAEGASPSLRVELRKPAGSNVNYELVQMD
jgi:hypothetical protein